MARKLAIFDFDHTMVDGNSDLAAIKLLKDSQIPDNVKKMFDKVEWQVYMQEIFKLLVKHNIPKSELQAAVEKIPEVENIKRLLIYLQLDLEYDIIVISDSNSQFIDWWLEAHHFKKYIGEIYTNPAEYDADGLLHIKGYHVQNECKHSDPNLCKAQVLKEHLAMKQKEGIKYDKIVYAGDGRNDLCPLLDLKEDDLACVRKGYALEKMLLRTHSFGGRKINSLICFWNVGDDVINFINKTLVA